MTTIIDAAGTWYDRLVTLFQHFDGVASLLLRLILAPVLILAGWEKITGENWFGSQLESSPTAYACFEPVHSDLSGGPTNF